MADGDRDSSDDGADSNDGDDSSDDGSYDGGDGSDGNPGSGGTSAECRAFDDEESPGFVEIELVNSTSATIYLGQDTVNCRQLPFFQVTDDDGNELATSGYDCFASCEELRDGQFIGCPTICRYPSARRLEAGESTRVLWDARFLMTTELPASCAPERESASCEQWRAQDGDALTFSARAFSELDCTDTLGDCSDDCDEADGGGCDVPGALVTGTALVTAPATSSEIDSVVTLVFDDP